MIDSLIVKMSDNGNCQTINHDCLLEAYQILKMLPPRFKQCKVGLKVFYNNSRLNLDLNRFTLLLLQESTKDYRFKSLDLEIKSTLKQNSSLMDPLGREYVIDCA